MEKERKEPANFPTPFPLFLVVVGFQVVVSIDQYKCRNCLPPAPLPLTPLASLLLVLKRRLNYIVAFLVGEEHTPDNQPDNITNQTAKHDVISSAVGGTKEKKKKRSNVKTPGSPR